MRALIAACLTGLLSCGGTDFDELETQRLPDTFEVDEGSSGSARVLHVSYPQMSSARWGLSRGLEELSGFFNLPHRPRLGGD